MIIFRNQISKSQTGHMGHRIQQFKIVTDWMDLLL